MRRIGSTACLSLLWLTLLTRPAAADNPLILDQFTADPTARVFDGTLYIYPSHDIPPIPGKTRPDWFCMEDYHVFSTTNLLDFTDHGVIVTQTAVPWVDANTYSMWAPDCVAKDGKYYFFFPARGKDGGFHIGVATADHPTGPFTPQAEPIAGVSGIDPCVLIDKDGAAYLYYAMASKLFVAKLKENLHELAEPPKVIENLPQNNLKEGPFVFERGGTYYLTYPHVENKTERLEYATGPGPTGPFIVAGVIMDESASGCWTNHQSIVQFKGQWYLFYHDDDLSPKFDKNRSIHADFLTFEPDGKIRKVVPTLRGVGSADATKPLQIDRYSSLSQTGASVSFLDETNPKAGWQVQLSAAGATVRYDRVDFGDGKLNAVFARCRAEKGGRFEIRLDHPDAPPLATIDLAAGAEWMTPHAALSSTPSGVHDLIVTSTTDSPVDVDWVRFQTQP